MKFLFLCVAVAAVLSTADAKCEVSTIKAIAIYSKAAYKVYQVLGKTDKTWMVEAKEMKFEMKLVQTAIKFDGSIICLSASSELGIRVQAMVYQVTAYFIKNKYIDLSLSFYQEIITECWNIVQNITVTINKEQTLWIEKLSLRETQITERIASVATTAISFDYKSYTFFAYALKGCVQFFKLEEPKTQAYKDDVKLTKQVFKECKIAVKKTEFFLINSVTTLTATSEFTGTSLLLTVLELQSLVLIKTATVSIFASAEVQISINRCFAILIEIGLSLGATSTLTIIYELQARVIFILVQTGVWIDFSVANSTIAATTLAPTTVATSALSSTVGTSSVSASASAASSTGCCICPVTTGAGCAKRVMTGTTALPTSVTQASSATTGHSTSQHSSTAGDTSATSCVVPTAASAACSVTCPAAQC